MKKYLAILTAVLLIFSMTAAFAFNWDYITAVECSDYVLSVTKYAKINSDLGVAYEKAPGATAKVGDYVYFYATATDAKGEAVHADIEYHHLGNIEFVDGIYRAKVIGDKPWVKISVVEKTAMTDLEYDGKPIIIRDDTVTIGKLVFTRNSDGVVIDVNSRLNVADMLAELAKLGIDIQKLYDGKICMNDDVLVSNFGHVCKNSVTAMWYVEVPLDIPKTGDAVSIITPILAIATVAYVTFRKR